MIRKSVQRFSEKIMLNQKSKSAMAIRPNPIALWTQRKLQGWRRHAESVNTAGGNIRHRLDRPFAGVSRERLEV
jgi:hypothetical protein